ncbi:MAG TPA: DegV family protein [Chloroflexota bacterium]|nr:DegV family protein [Chloroflexota bacterium]
MARVVVVTDSTADMGDGDMERLKISMVPLNVLWNGETFRDKVDMSLEEFYRKLRTDNGSPRTSQPSAGQFVEVYQRLLQEADAIVSIHISGAISGTINAAQAAAQQVAPEKITVVDSRNLAWPEGALVTKTAEAAQSGASLRECVEFAEALVPRLRLYCAADTLEYLMRGGRVTRLQAFAGTLLAIKPMLHVVDGKLVPAERVRTRAAAVKKMAELMLAEGPLEEAAVLYADVREPAEELYRIIHEARPELPIKWGRTGAVIGAHNGPGLYGVYGLAAE